TQPFRATWAPSSASPWCMLAVGDGRGRWPVIVVPRGRRTAGGADVIPAPRIPRQLGRARGRPHGALAVGRGRNRLYRVVLSACHLDHDPATPAPRLAAYCQACHLRYDALQRWRTRRPQGAGPRDRGRATPAAVSWWGLVRVRG